MILALFDSRGRQAADDDVIAITTKDLMVDPDSRVPEEISFVLKFSGFMKEWPTLILADGVPYKFNGQDAIPRDWAYRYCGAATYVRVDEPVFKMTHNIFEHVEIFVPSTAPDWLTSKNTVPDSIMDQRWFWNDYVLGLKVGEHADTDFRRIVRIR